MVENKQYSSKTKYRQLFSGNQPVVLLSFVLVLFSTMIIRLFWMQIVKGASYKKLSDENRIRLISTAPVRGQILDRKGNILADSRLTYTLSV